MDIIVVIAAAVMAAPILTPVPVPRGGTAVMKKSHVIMVAATTIALMKMMTN